MLAKKVIACVVLLGVSSALRAAVTFQVLYLDKPLEGAKVVIRGKNGDVIDGQVTDKNGNVVSKALPGKHKTVSVEVKPPPQTGIAIVENVDLARPSPIKMKIPPRDK